MKNWHAMIKLINFNNKSCITFYIQEQTEFQHQIKDNYVNIIEENILDGKDSQFTIRSGSYTFDVPYDGGSVMHYGSTAFGIKVDGVKQTTIESLVCNNQSFEIPYFRE